MNDSSSPRPTLKLKVAPRKPANDIKISAPPAQNKAKQKPGAHWSDEYKERMQREMDELAR